MSVEVLSDILNEDIVIGTLRLPLDLTTLQRVVEATVRHTILRRGNSIDTVGIERLIVLCSPVEYLHVAHTMLFLVDDELHARHLWELSVGLRQESHQLIQHREDGTTLHFCHYDIVVVRQQRKKVAIGQIARLHLITDTATVQYGNIRACHKAEGIRYDVACIGLSHTVDLITLVIRNTQIYIAMTHQSARLCVQHGIDAIHYFCHVCILLLHALDGDE